MKKILVAEDDLVSRTMIVKAIESTGNFAIQCGNGRRAWELLNDNSDISLLVTDVMMPEMDGRQLIQVIRGNESFKKLPIIIISGVVKINEIDSLLQLGASRFLAKPINMAELKDYIVTLSTKSDSSSTQVASA